MEKAIENLKKWAESNGFMLISEGDYWCFGKRHRLTFINTQGQLHEYSFLSGGEVVGGTGQTLHKRASLEQ